MRPWGARRRYLTAQCHQPRRVRLRRDARQRISRAGHFALSPHHDRCALRRDAGARPPQNRSAQYGGCAPSRRGRASPAQNAGNNRARGARIEVGVGRIESFEGACRAGHGPGGRRGVIVDDFRHCGGPDGGNRWHLWGFSHGSTPTSCNATSSKVRAQALWLDPALVLPRRDHGTRLRFAICSACSAPLIRPSDKTRRSAAHSRKKKRRYAVRKHRTAVSCSIYPQQSQRQQKNEPSLPTTAAAAPSTAPPGQRGGARRYQTERHYARLLRVRLRRDGQLRAFEAGVVSRAMLPLAPGRLLDFIGAGGFSSRRRPATTSCPRAS